VDKGQPLYSFTLIRKADNQKRSKNTDVRATGEKNLGPIKKKLAGIIQEKGMVMTVPNQVDWLIKQATGPAQLVSLP